MNENVRQDHCEIFLKRCFVVGIWEHLDDKLRNQSLKQVIITSINMLGDDHTF